MARCEHQAGGAEHQSQRLWSRGVNISTSSERFDVDDVDADRGLHMLFHQLNNQLGVVLAHAELLEAKAGDPSVRTRAEQVVKSVLAAMGTAREIRRRSEPSTFA